MNRAFEPFEREQPPQRVVFGAGRVDEIPAELARLEAQRVLVVAGPSALPIAARLEALLGDLVVATWGRVMQHVPDDIASAAQGAAADCRADTVLAIGGGSAIGTAKAIALSTGAAIVAVPTTYSGSEQTAVYGITGGAHKRTGKDPRVRPRCVVYDPELTLDLPLDITNSSAFNALAHSVESLYAPGHNPVTSLLALEGVRALRTALPAVTRAPRDLAARSTLLYGAYLAGAALGETATAIHHKLCHVLGGTFGLVHAEVHSVMLPYVVAFNAPSLPREMTALADALGSPSGDPAELLWDLAFSCGLPTSLAALGLARGHLTEAARRAVAEIGANPRPFDERDLVSLLERAHRGARPSAGAAVAPTVH
jgi:maleylacetate reductase